MNILIIGGAGHIGSATAEALWKAEHSVTVYVWTRHTWHPKGYQE